ncbi:hypothetical protein D9757_006103 [Collybiopsis confluens]|uniref:Uncharacterized protein n=1 Tax=Collybiopsis confluens TaxID=2823264 RepID=A0A8H5HI98_9AGAR|nr:hypothetical protein D9757_006103 [Collybiopsis confluens]
MSDLTEFPVTQVGTPSFVPALLTCVRNAATGLPIEPVIFQSLLLCLICGNKHLILRTSEDDIGLVVKLTVKTLATVFGILTHRLRIHRRPGTLDYSTASSVSAFLRSLFVPGAPLSTLHDETQTMTSHGARKYRKRPSSGGSRSRSTSQYIKSPNDVTSTKSFHFAPSVSLSTVDPFGEYQSALGASFYNSASRSSSFSVNPHPALPHSYSDPTPLRSSRDPTQIQLPDALVISGLEHANLASQRALTSVLNEGQIVLNDSGAPNDVEMRTIGHRHSKSTLVDTEMTGIWPLPKDFILVYVCSLDERERPAIHKSLLDKFAMSATVSLHPTIRSLSKSFFRPPSHRGSSIVSPAPQVATYPPDSTPPFLTQQLPSHRQISPGVMTPSNGSHAIISQEAMTVLKEIHSKVHIPSTLNLYTSDLFSAARHHHQLEGRLLSIGAMHDALDLSRAARILGGDFTGLELVESVLTAQDDDKLDGSSTADEGANGDERLPKAMTATDVGSAYVMIDPIETRLSGEEGLESVKNEVVSPVLDVTQADIARIVPRVLSHRLRVRDGPEDEVLAGAIFSALFSASLSKAEREKRELGGVTVKELLISILQDV